MLDANDQPPIFVPSSLFAAVEEDTVFGTSIAQLRVSRSYQQILSAGLKRLTSPYCVEIKQIEGLTVSLSADVSQSTVM